MRSFDEWFDENCDGSDLAKDACRKLWDEFSDQINIICRKSYEKQQSKVDELKLQVAEMKSRLNDAYTAGQSAMYAARQSKVDELERIIELRDQQLTEEIALSTKYVGKFDELQKRVDAAFRVLSQLNALDDEAHKRWKREACMFSQGESNAYEHAVRLLEQALKGGEAC